jgi:phage tail tape-measure protein
MAREYTNRILELYEEGALDANDLVRDLLGWMSEDDAKAFYHSYDLDAAYEGENDE